MNSDQSTHPLVENLSTSELLEVSSTSQSLPLPPKELEITQQTLIETEEEMSEFNSAFLEDSENTLVIEESTVPPPPSIEPFPKPSGIRNIEGGEGTSVKRNQSFESEPYQKYSNKRSRHIEPQLFCSFIPYGIDIDVQPEILSRHVYSVTKFNENQIHEKLQLDYKKELLTGYVSYREGSVSLVVKNLIPYAIYINGKNNKSEKGLVISKSSIPDFLEKWTKLYSESQNVTVFQECGDLKIIRARDGTIIANQNVFSDYRECRFNEKQSHFLNFCINKIYEIAETYYHLVELKELVLKECISKTHDIHLEGKESEPKSGEIVYKQILNGWIARESYYPCHLIMGDYLRLAIRQKLRQNLM